MAIAAGFGLNLETCDPEVFAAVEEALIEREKARQSEQRMADLKARLG